MIEDVHFHHGGQLDRIKQGYPDQQLPWVDLSTGISPFSYPIDVDVQSSYQCLPQGHKKLIAAASSFYGVDNGLPIPGSMWAIQHLPLIRKVNPNTNTVNDIRPVLLPRVGFNEHAKAWSAWGFNIEYYENMPSTDQLERVQACIVINPNNPTGVHYQKQDLLKVHKKLSDNNAWLIVDEAFMDLTPEHSCIKESWQQDLIVLRSFGKYFGLPGIRLGSLMASEAVIADAKKLLNEWSINSAAQQVATTAYLDTEWQYEINKRIKVNSARLKKLLESLNMISQGSDFFQTHISSNAESMCQHLLRLGVYVRLLDDQSGIRIGLPREEDHWSRLEAALKSYIKLNIKPLNTVI